MLVELRIRNLAVFTDTTFAPAPGLSVLSGETGAGKSLIVGAVLLLLGERGGSDRVRVGAERAVVEGVFEVRDVDGWAEWLDARGVGHEFPQDRTLILRREVAAGGRSRAWINGGAVTTAVLGETGQRLVTVYGQHESQALATADAQREALDGFAGALEQAARVATAHATWRTAVERRSALDDARVDAERRADYLRFVAREIEEARLEEGEDERIEDELRRLTHAESLRTFAADAAERLDGDEDGSVMRALAQVRRALGQLVRIDPTMARLEELLDQAEMPLGELVQELQAYGDGIDLDPARLRAVEARRDVVHSVLRKHGPTVADAQRALDDARAAIALVDDGETARRDADRAVAESLTAWRGASGTLSAARTRAASQLATEVSTMLPALGMPDGRLVVELTSLEAPDPRGAERVEWLVQLNAGDTPRPLGRVASGGELARVMLAVATVLAQVGSVPTIVFDEIDAGIGGAVAVQVGQAMQRLAQHHQVLAVTHLAQIAACAALHGAVSKASADGRTEAQVTVVDGDARIGELARMLGGDAVRDVARQHARELLAQAMDAGARAAVAVSAERGRRVRRREPRGG
ncbi:MAG: DNA repair protein RecN [Gemmatimonadaceae bacterium]|nr:DNA repair protein RecN [Gemmatimonadaceae bacterium]